MGHVGFYIDCHRMTVPENILLQKSTADIRILDDIDSYYTDPYCNITQTQT